MNSYLAMSHSKAKMWPACIKQGCCWLWSLQASLPLQSWASVSFASLKVLGASSSPRPKKATPCPPGCASGERSQAVPGSSGVTAQSFLQAARRWWLAVTVLFPISGVCLRVFSLFILVWLIYSLCLPWIMFTITTRDQFCHSKILKKKKKKIIHGSQDICTCCLKPNTCPDSETLSIIYYITLSHESKGEHFRVSCWKAFWFVHAAWVFFLTKIKGLIYF